MNFDQLRVFVAVAERQHMTRAAEELNIAQSAVSTAIAAFEARHGLKLFDRIGRRIELTEAGRLFLGEARGVLARVAAAELALAELNGLKRGTLAVHASKTIASYWLPRYLVAFHAAHPDMQIRLTIGNTSEVAKAVHEGIAELGFIEGEIEDPLLRVGVVATDQLVIVVAPDHDWAGRRDIAPADLVDLKWVLREPGSGTRSEFEAAIVSFGISPNDLKVAMVLPSNESVRAAVEAGLGATALSGSVAAPSLEAGLLELIRVTLPPRDFYSVRHHERTLSRAAQAFLDLLG